jgi:hypothetical protein
MEISPKNVGKVFDNADYFKMASGYMKRTNIHGRDAAKMVWRWVKV